MSEFCTKVSGGKENKIIEHAFNFAEEIEPKLIRSAQNGYSGYEIQLEHREDSHILKNPKFLEHLEMLLDGCKVTIEKDEFTNIIFKTKYYKYKLVVNWK